MVTSVSYTKDVKNGTYIRKRGRAKLAFFKKIDREYVSVVKQVAHQAISETVLLDQFVSSAWTLVGLDIGTAKTFSHIIQFIVAISKKDKKTATDLLTMVLRALSGTESRKGTLVDDIKHGWKGVGKLINQT
jgi:hypothetical protein